MIVNRGYVFRLKPTPAQAGAMAHAAGVCRLVYNLALEQRRDHWKQFLRSTGRHVSLASQCRELTQLRGEFDWIAAVSQTAQQQALRDLDRAYQGFFEGRADYPSFRRKGENDAFRVHGREVAVRRLNRNWGMVKLPKVGEVRFRWTRDVPGTIKNATVRLDPLGWHVSFATEFEVEVPKNHRPAVGADRGVVEAVAYSDGTFAAFPRKSVSRLERRARDAAHASSRCRKGSARRKVAKARVAALRAKLARVRRHFNHVETARLARTYGVVCLEDLRIKSMTASARGTVEEPGRNVAQKAGLNRAILEVGWGQYKTFLEYKMAAAGGEVRLVPAAHTSTTCASCGHRDASSRKSQAAFECTGCGMSANADTNAARNILRAGTRPCDARRGSPAGRRGSRQGATGLAA